MTFWTLPVQGSPNLTALMNSFNAIVFGASSIFGLAEKRA